MIKCINMTSAEYKNLQDNLSNYQQELAKSSLENLKELING